jgi:uncharacterized protein (UPF0248 family)
MSRLPTSKETYDHIRWDTSLDPLWFSLAYEDRELGVVEVPFESFVPEGDVPWHRVRQFRCGDAIVWDRASRTNLFAMMPPPSAIDSELAGRRFADAKALEAWARGVGHVWPAPEAADESASAEESDGEIGDREGNAGPGNR